MPSWSRRAQVEPLAALAAVFAVGIGLSLYVGVLDATLPELTPDRRMAVVAADRVLAESSELGSVRPPIDDSVAASSPAGHRLNTTLRVDDTARSAGPPRRASADCVVRRVSVTVAPGRVRPGRLEVCTWPAA